MVGSIATPFVGVGSHRRTGEHGEKALMTLWRNLVVALVAAFALAACSSSSDNGGTTSTETETSTTAEQTPAERQMTLIESAQLGLEMALSALDADDPTADRIEAVRDAMTLLESALAGAVDLSPNQTMEAWDDLADARDAARDAQTTLDTGIATAGRIRMQMMDISDAQEALSEALEGDEIADLAAANSAYDDLEETIEDGSDLTDAQKAMAVSDLNAADVAIAKAEMAKYDADAMAEGATDAQMLAAYQGKLAAARRLASADAASTDDLATANMAIGASETKIAELQDDIEDAEDAVADERRMVSNAASMQVAEAINAHTVAGDPPSEFLAPASPSTTPGATDFGISRGSGNAEIVLTQTAADARSKAFGEGTAQDAGPGWMGTTFMRSGTSAKRPYTEMAAVYSDIEVAGDLAWTQTALNGLNNGLAVGTGGVVTITADTSVNAEHLSGILPSVPQAGETSSRNIAANTEVSGSFYGVRGTYSCAGTACAVTRNADGDVTLPGLTFTPLNFNAATTVAKYADPDEDYTHFGYWMKSTTQRDGTQVHDIETFHDGSGAAALATIGSGGLEGTASYYGAAAGVYVKKDGAGDSLMVTDGTFTADAELTATFGGNNIAVNKQNRVSGTISGFMDGSTELGFDDLSLGASPFDDANNGDLAVGLFSGSTDGGGKTGEWSGEFHGNIGGTVTTAQFPANVSGEFNGHFTNGHVAGAFGAEYDQ